jgi:hypothetical protein
LEKRAGHRLWYRRSARVWCSPRTSLVPRVFKVI